MIPFARIIRAAHGSNQAVPRSAVLAWCGSYTRLCPAAVKKRAILALSNVTAGLSTENSAVPKHEMPDTGRNMYSELLLLSWGVGAEGATCRSGSVFRAGQLRSAAAHKIGSRTQPQVLPQHREHTKSIHISFLSSYCVSDSRAVKPVQQLHLLLAPWQVQCMLQRGDPRRCHRLQPRHLALFC